MGVLDTKRLHDTLGEGWVGDPLICEPLQPVIFLGNKNLMNVVVTGGAGFIGSALVRHLVEATDYGVVNFDKLTYAGNLDALAEVSGDSRYTLEVADICDAPAVRGVLERHRPIGVIHLAAESHVDRSIDSPGDCLSTNILGTATLLEETRRYLRAAPPDVSRRFRFHHVSTDEVYGDLETAAPAFTEATPYEPSSPYSASKAASDHLVRAWHRTYGLPVLVTNCSNNYGPYHFPEKFIPHMIVSALGGNPMPVYGDGQQIRDWLHVEDHARALLLAFERGRVGRTYNIGGGNERSNLDVVRKICGLLDVLVETKPDGIPSFSDLITYVEDRPGHDRRYAIDASRMREELGWAPQHSFETGIEHTVRWYLDRRDWWQPLLSKHYALRRIGLAS